MSTTPPTNDTQPLVDHLMDMLFAFHRAVQDGATTAAQRSDVRRAMLATLATLEAQEMGHISHAFRKNLWPSATWQVAP